jgi:co-chaperonin GroES (HSP10)
MIVLKKVKPMFTSLITTAEKYEADLKTSGGIIDTTKAGTLKEYQTVLAVGPDVRGVKVGDLICINPANYAVRKYDKSSTKEAMTEHYNAVIGYNFNFIEINNELCLKLRDSDIDFIVEEFDDVEEPDNQTNKSNLIIPERKLIIP